MTDTVAAISPVSSLRLRSWTMAPRSPSGPASTVATRSTSGWSSGGSAGWPVTSDPTAGLVDQPELEVGVAQRFSQRDLQTSRVADAVELRGHPRHHPVADPHPQRAGEETEGDQHDQRDNRPGRDLPPRLVERQQPLAGAHEHDQLEGVVRRHDGCKRTSGDDRSQDPAAHRPRPPQSQQRQRRDTEGGRRR